MQDEDKTIDVGEANEEAQEIDLDAPAPEQSLEEEQIDVEQISEDDTKSEDTPAESDVSKDVQKDELGEYSEGVQKRIAKLTRKMREAERQKEEAIAYAQQVNEQAKNMRGQYDQLGDNYTKELEAKVATGMDAAKLAYRQAVENQDIDGQVAAQQALAKMAIEEQRLANIKVGQEQKLAQTPQPTTQPVAQPQQYQQPQAPVDPQADAWATKNAWFAEVTDTSHQLIPINNQNPINNFATYAYKSPFDINWISTYLQPEVVDPNWVKPYLTTWKNTLLDQNSITIEGGEEFRITKILRAHQGHYILAGNMAKTNTFRLVAIKERALIAAKAFPKYTKPLSTTEEFSTLCLIFPKRST